MESCGAVVLSRDLSPLPSYLAQEDSDNDEAKYLAYLIDLYLYDGFGPEGYIFGANSQRRSPSEHPERFYAEIFEDSPRCSDLALVLREAAQPGVAVVRG